MKLRLDSIQFDPSIHPSIAFPMTRIITHISTKHDLYYTIFLLEASICPCLHVIYQSFDLYIFFFRKVSNSAFNLFSAVEM